MKRFWPGTLGLVVLGIAALAMATTAAAADLPARPYGKAPWVEPIYDWTGFYVGANAGYGSSRKCWDFAPGGVFFAPEGCRVADGGIAGGQVGYRWQSGTIVFGLEAQGDWADLEGGNVSLVTGNTDRSRLDAFGLFTGQIGLAWNSALLYLKGGAAIVSNRYDVLSPGGTLLASAGGNTRWGGTAGVGVEYGLTPNWTFAVEYDHIFLDSRFTTLTAPGGAVFSTDRISGDTDTIAARVNYRWGGPVVARY
jgi:outer membrane immunogenic protein